MFYLIFNNNIICEEKQPKFLLKSVADLILKNNLEGVFLSNLPLISMIFKRYINRFNYNEIIEQKFIAIEKEKCISDYIHDKLVVYDSSPHKTVDLVLNEDDYEYLEKNNYYLIFGTYPRASTGKIASETEIMNDYLYYNRYDNINSFDKFCQMYEIYRWEYLKKCIVSNVKNVYNGVKQHFLTFKIWYPIDFEIKSMCNSLIL